MSKQSQLETWSKYQELVILKETYNSVKNTLKDFKLPNNATYVTPYLQGSYGNDTHIYSKSDIDIVVELNSAFRSNLTGVARSKYNNATYTLNEFERDLSIFLIEKYTKDFIEIGTKTIKIKTNNRKMVDIVPCIQYRYYENPNDVNSKYYGGISLKDKVNNFPRIHMENGKVKRSNTNKMYKKYIRIFKNFRKKVGEHFPSYFIECLLYNVPDDKFDIELTNGFEKITDWLKYQNDKSQFVCQNGIIKLFGNQSTQWNENLANDFINRCVEEYHKF